MFLGQMSCYGCLTVKDTQPIVVFVSGHGGRVTSGMSLTDEEGECSGVDKSCPHLREKTF